MTDTQSADTTADRVARHRAKTAAEGAKRVEVTVPAADVSLVKAIAGALREGQEEAARIREAVGPILAPGAARTGAELVAFLRASPLVGAELDVARDRTAGRTADLG